VGVEPTSNVSSIDSPVEELLRVRCATPVEQLKVEVDTWSSANRDGVEECGAGS